MTFNNKILQKKHDRLFTLIRNLTTKIDSERALPAIIDAAIDITGATSGTLILIDWEKHILKIKVQRGFSNYISNIELKVGEGITGYVAKTGKSLLVSDVQKNSVYVKIKKNIRSEIAVPLILNKKVIGVVNVDSSKKNAFSNDDLRLLIILADQSSRVIQNANLYETIKRQAEEFKTLNEVNRFITVSLDLDMVLNLIVQKSNELMGTKICSIMMVSGDELVLRAVHGSSHAYISKPNLPIKSSLIGKVIITGNPLHIEDVTKNKLYHYPDIARKEGIRSLLSVPLIVKEKIIGCLNIYKGNPVSFSPDEVHLLASFANQSAIALENARLYQDVIHMENDLRKLEKLTTAGEIALGIAHEIRNPLTIINMLFQNPSSLNKKDVDVIHRELGRINDTLKYFLSFYKFKAPIFKDNINLNKILEQTLSLLSMPIRRKSIHLKKNLSESLPGIRGDAGQMSQVFMNLILNAIDCLDEGGIIVLRTHYVHKSNEVVFSLKDNGPGIPLALQEKLFHPFVTTKTNGMGLGLSVVRRIVESHNGHIHFQSSDNGTIFAIHIPRSHL